MNKKDVKQPGSAVRAARGGEGGEEDQGADRHARLPLPHLQVKL